MYVCKDSAVCGVLWVFCECFASVFFKTVFCHVLRVFGNVLRVFVFCNCFLQTFSHFLSERKMRSTVLRIALYNCTKKAYFVCCFRFVYFLICLVLLCGKREKHGVKTHTKHRKTPQNTAKHHKTLIFEKNAQNTNANHP